MAATIVQPKPGPVEGPPPKARTKPQRTLEATIRRAVLRELRRQEGNLSRTARELAISRQTLLNYLDAWGLRVEEVRSDRTRKVWRGLPGEIRAYRAVENRFSRSNPKKDYAHESDYDYARRQHLYQQRGGESDLDVIREVMCGTPAH